VHLAVPDHLVPRVRAQARNLENHDLCNKVIGRQRQFTAHAILHAKPSLPDETFRQFREDNRRAARARNAWADEPLGDPDFPALPGPVARPCADAATQTNPFDTDPVASEWPSPPTSGLGNPPPGALTAYVTHDSLEQRLDRFPSFDDLKAVLLQVPPRVQEAIPPAISAGIGPVANRLAELEARVLQVESVCLSFGDRVTNMENKYRRIESALDHDRKDFYRCNGLSAYAGFESALSGAACWDHQGGDERPGGARRPLGERRHRPAPGRPLDGQVGRHQTRQPPTDLFDAFSYHDYASL